MLNRSISLSVAGPIESEWSDLREKLKIMHRQATDLANWCVLQHLRAESDLHPSTGKFSKAPKLDCYNLGFTKKGYPKCSEWEGCKQSASAIVTHVRQAWIRQRFAVLGRHEMWAASYRYPYPWPVTNQSYKAFFDEEHRPCVSVTLPGGRVGLRLRGGQEFRRQLAILKRIVAGDYHAGEMKIVSQRSTKSTKRPTVSNHEANGGGRQWQSRVMVRISYSMPEKEAPEDSTHTMVVRTDPNAFWVAELADHAPWIVNADHLRRWVQEHKVYLQRMAEDTKYEKRWPKRRRQQMNDSREVRCDKHSRRVDSFIHDVAAALVNYASRNKVREIMYDDENQTYLPSFPWYKVASRLKEKLEAVGMVLTARQSPDVSE